MNDFTHKNIPGWMDFEFFYSAILDRSKSGDILVELGCWNGKSVCYMAQEANRRNLNVKIYVVDIFDNDSYSYAECVKTDPAFAGCAPRLFDEFAWNMNRAGVLNLVTSLIGDSANSAKCFADGSVSFVFVDADHSFDAVCRDVDAWLPKLTPNGILAGHDISFDGVRRAVESRFPGYVTIGSCWSHRPFNKFLWK